LTQKNPYLIVIGNDAPEDCQRPLTSVVDRTVNVEHWWSDTDGGIKSAWKKIFVSANLLTTNVTGAGLYSKEGLFGERLTANCFSHGKLSRRL